jgi:ABC-2 type transport system permease protein
MNAFRALLLSETRVLMRDRMTLFFTLLFPLVFILIFGFLMRDIGDVTHSTLGVYVASGTDSDVLDAAIAASGTMAAERFDSEDAAEAAVLERRVDFAVAFDGTELRFLYDADRIQENYAFQQAARGIAADFNLRRQGATRALMTEAIDVGRIESTSWFHLVLPGILAFSVLSSGLFAVSGHLTAMKERKVLDRMLVTPMPAVALLAAIVAVRLVIVFVSTLITLFVGILLFRLHYDVSWLRYVALVVCATIGTMGIGTIIALVVRRPSSAGNVANALAMIMMFLAGVYFPIEFMPAFLRAISQGMPLTHMANAMRYATGVMDMAEPEFWAIVLSLLAIGVLLFPVLAGYVVRPLRR